MANEADNLERSALAAVNIGAWAWDIAQDRITWSEGLDETFGRKPSKYWGRLSDVLQMIHPEDRARFDAELAQIRTAAAVWNMRHRLNVPGRERWVHARGRVMRGADGQAQRMLGIVEDVSTDHALEIDRSERSGLMQSALDASLFAVLVLDTSGRVIYSNQLAADLLGLTREGAQASTYDAAQFKHTAVDGGPWPDENQPFVRVMKTGGAVHGIEHCIERPGGRVVTLRINAAPIKNDRGEIKLVVCSFEDITERRAIEAAFRQTQKLEAVGRLAGGVAHDFNNLLTAIMSFAAMARGEAKDPKAVVECLDGITDASERAAQLTRQLLAFARREVNHPTTFDVRAEVSASARLIARILGGPVTLDFDVPAQPCFVRMDSNHLQQILLNLAINARDAMPEGGKILISVERTNRGTVLLAVTDTGYGMDQETMHKAFEPFFTTKPAHEGTGLGLSTCHGIVVQAGGRIRLSSELGRGTRVEIELPLAAAAKNRTAASKRPEASEGQGGGRVLIVEDDPAVQRIAVQTLERAGYEVHAATHADRALEMLRLHAIDMIVCDLVLPGMSGPDLIDRVRQTQPGMRVLFVSGYSSELARIGIEPFLPKPYSPEVLRRRVADALAT